MPMIYIPLLAGHFYCIIYIYIYLFNAQLIVILYETELINHNFFQKDLENAYMLYKTNKNLLFF